MLPASTLGEIDLAQFLFERGRVLALRTRYSAAEYNFQHALGLLRKQHPACPAKPLALALLSLAAVQIDLNKLNQAARHLNDIILMTPRLPADVAEISMRVVARYCLARGDVQQHAKALHTINEIVREECPCPVGRAVAYLEMKVGEAASGLAAEARTCVLQSSLKTLRRSKSHHELVGAASRLLDNPNRRCFVKTHPEDAEFALLGTAA
jgi:hypothetical protein